MTFKGLTPLWAKVSGVTQSLRRVRGAPSKERSWADHSAAIRNGVEADLPVLEGVFVQISEQLSILDTHCQEMLSQCDQLKDLASGQAQGGSLIEAIRTLLQMPLAYIDECLAKQQQLLSLVLQCQERTEVMLRVRAKMADALAPLSFMTVLFKIESAYLSEDKRDTFITVTVEIEKLRGLVEETFKKNTALLTTTHDTLRQVHSKLDEDFTRQAKVVGDKRRGIDKAFLNLDQQVASNASRDNKMHTISSQLAQQVSQVVMGLQFQDIFKQKCEHVLKELGSWERKGASGEFSKEIDGCHLDQAVGELNGGIQSVRSGINLIRELMEQLENHSLMQDESGDMENSDGLVQLLLDTIQEVHDIIRGMAELTEHAHAAVKPAGEIAMSMSSALTELAINMQHIALNAQVRSVWIGAGTGLEELAARTAEISNEISHISEQTNTDLASLQSTINEMLCTFDDFRIKGREQLSHLDGTRSQTETRLHSLRDHTITTIHTIGTGVDAIRGCVSALNEQLTAMDEVSNRMNSRAEELEKLFDETGVKRRTPVAPVASQAATVAVAGSDDFGFDAPAVPTAEPVAPVTVNTQKSDKPSDVELF